MLLKCSGIQDEWNAELNSTTEKMLVVNFHCVKLQNMGRKFQSRKGWSTKQVILQSKFPLENKHAIMKTSIKLWHILTKCDFKNNKKGSFLRVALYSEREASLWLFLTQILCISETKFYTLWWKNRSNYQLKTLKLSWNRLPSLWKSDVLHFWQEKPAGTSSNVLLQWSERFHMTLHRFGANREHSWSKCLSSICHFNPPEERKKEKICMCDHWNWFLEVLRISCKVLMLQLFSVKTVNSNITKDVNGN